MDSIILEAINVTANGPECIGELHTMNKEDLHAVFTGQTFTTKKNSIPGIVPAKMTNKEGVPAQNILVFPLFCLSPRLTKPIHAVKQLSSGSIEKNYI